MSVSPKSLWQVPAYLPYLQPELTDEALRKAEEGIGFRLPSEYVALLRQQNGGYIRWQLPDEVHDILRGIGPNYPALEAYDWSGYDEWLPFALEEGSKMIPFDGDGHWMLCLDYRGDATNPSVTKVDTEGVFQEPVAASFADYLQLLEPDVDEGSLALLNLVDLEKFKQDLGIALRMGIDVPSDLDRGYFVHRLIRQGEHSPECIWISSNLVPRGFVRKADDPNSLMRSLMPGMARRFPGLPEDVWTMTVSEKIIPEVLSVLRTLGVEVKPLIDCHGLT